MTGFGHGRYVLHPGNPLVCDGPWLDAYAVVAEGAVDLCTARGARLRLVAGDVFTLARIGPATLVAVGPGDAVVTTTHLVKENVAWT